MATTSASFAQSAARLVALGYAGGFVGPLLVGCVLDLSGGMSQLGWGLSFSSVAMLMALALVTFWVIRPRKLEGDRRKAR